MIVVVLWLGMVSVFGQQPAKYDMETIVRVLAEQIPEINRKLPQPDTIEGHYILYNIEDKEIGSARLQIYRYQRPSETTDQVLVAYDIHNFPAAAWIQCYTLDRKTGVFTPDKLPFELLPPCCFDKEEFDEDHNYWRIAYTIFDNGNVLITASPGMSYQCVMLARWDGKKSFTLYKRAIYDYTNMEIGKDDAQTEQYVQNVVRPNFQRINDISRWVYIEKKENLNLTLEGSKLTYYYSNTGLEKMVANLYGESFGSVIEYYFIDGILSFIYDITTQYSVSIFEAPDKTHQDTKTERRWYLKGNACIRGIGDKGQKLTPEQIREEFLGDGRGVFSLYAKIINL